MKRTTIALFIGLLCPLLSFAQRSISGKVLDDKGSPLASVSVFIKNTSKGTQTDQNGDFSITADGSGSVTLTFTFTGYVSTETSADGSAPVSVTMQTAENSLNNVIVVGYGTQ